MSFGVSVGDCIAIIKLANSVRERFEDAPAQYQALKEGVENLSNILSKIDNMFSASNGLHTHQKADLEKPLLACMKVLADLDAVLDKYRDLNEGTQATSRLGNKSKRLWIRLQWEPEDVKEIQSRLALNVDNLNAIMGTINLEITCHTKSGIDQLLNHEDRREHREILEWLSPSNFAIYQAHIQRQCQEGTGKWFISSREFQLWLDGRHPTLFCPGYVLHYLAEMYHSPSSATNEIPNSELSNSMPGAGKTAITSIVIDYLQNHWGRDESRVAIAFIYFNYKRPEEQTTENLLANLLKQLLHGHGVLPPEIRALHENHKSRGTRPTVAELSKLLSTAAQGYSKSLMLLDALDECEERVIIMTLLRELSTLHKRHLVGVFATSRDIPDVAATFTEGLTLEIRARDHDLNRYVENHLNSLPASIQRNLELRDMIETEIVAASDGMFLLARLHLESLADKTTIKAVKQALKDLPRGEGALKQAYEETLTRIESQLCGFALLARNALIWLVCAKRELTIEELRYALAIEECSPELDVENLEDAEEIISACKGLVTLDHETKIVHLVHYTTQEFFRGILPRWAPSAQENITKACLQYLSFQSIRSSLRGDGLKSPLCSDDLHDYVNAQYQDHVLLLYVLGHMMSHAKSCWNEAIEDLILKWLCDEETAALYLEAFVAKFYTMTPWMRMRTNNTALHRSAVLDCQAITARILSDGRVNVNATNGEGETALHTAAQYGRTAVTMLLLDQVDTQVDVQDESGSTPFMDAAAYGHEDVAIRLFGRDNRRINLQHNSRHFTALHSAARHGFETLASLLLERPDIQINLQSGYGKTPLWYAVEYGRKAIVELLLKQDGILVNLHASSYGTALIESARNKREAICALLLERDDVQVNLATSLTGTALNKAAVEGSHTIVRLLLQRDDIQVNLQSGEFDGGTALGLAVRNGRDTIVDLLLHREDIEVNLSCGTCAWPGLPLSCHGMTVLTLAARGGREATTRLLLLRNDIDVNMGCEVGGTALMYAARYGHEPVVRLILRRPEIQVNLQYWDDVIPIECSNRDFWRYNLKVHDFDLGTKFKPRCEGYNTALMYAAAYGHRGVVNMLLEKEDIQMDCRDKENRTALMLAYEHGYEDVVNSLEIAGAPGELPAADKRVYPTKSQDAPKSKGRKP